MSEVKQLQNERDISSAKKKNNIPKTNREKQSSDIVKNLKYNKPLENKDNEKENKNKKPDFNFEALIDSKLVVESN
jgi:uncharacterized membrane protein YfhO